MYNDSTINLNKDLKVTPFLVPHRDEYSETVGYKIQGKQKSALFIPDINKWNTWERNIIEYIKANKLGRKSSFFNTISMEEVEQNNFIINPFEIQEGIFECKCGSKKVLSYQKQSRSADEPSTTYAECVMCGFKWVYNG